MIDTEFLKPAVIVDHDKLPRDLKKQIMDLSGPRPARFFGVLLVNWILIFVAIAVSIFFSQWWLTVLAIGFISTRQIVMALLLHEQVHRLGLRGKYADWIVNTFVAYPMVVTTVEDYAQIHLAHHKYFFTDKDPDFIRKSGLDWSYPMPIKRFLLIVVKDILGLNFIKLIKGKTAKNNAAEFLRRNPTPFWYRCLFYIVVAFVLTYTHTWLYFFIYWVIPLLTFTQLGIRWIAITEHKYNIKEAPLKDCTPLIKPRLWEKLLFPDLNFSLHYYHHAHPGVSFCNLPKVHDLYVKHQLVDDSATFKGLLSYLNYLVYRK